jgi:glycine/D-amino acid oxidase-like deaminating enzyme
MAVRKVFPELKRGRLAGALDENSDEPGSPVLTVLALARSLRVVDVGTHALSELSSVLGASLAGRSREAEVLVIALKSNAELDRDASMKRAGD